MKSLAKNLFIFPLFVLLVMFFSYSHGCTCRRMTVEQYLENSDYSCTFKVLERVRREEWHAIYYKMTKIACEKVNEKAEQLLGANVTYPITMRTPKHESMCGIELTVGNTYKIMGQVSTSGEILVFLCNYVKQIEPALP